MLYIIYDGSLTERRNPLDPYDQILVSNAHPPDWENPEPALKYDLVVIGAGTAGLVTAAGSAGLGARVALVEKHLLGGDCLNVGCVPSKALLRAARAYADVRDAKDYGVIVPDGFKADFPKVMERMRRLRSQISPNDSARRFKSLGVDVFLGEGIFTGKDTVEVNGKKLKFSRAVLATGARAAAPLIPGIEEAGYLTNETVFSLTELPPRLAVIGAGPIGCELSQAFARFGSKVTMLEVAKQILIREDPDAAQKVESSLRRDGVEIVTDCKIKSVGKRDKEKVFQLDCSGKACELAVDAILVGVGRAPNVEGLGLETAGVEYDTRSGVKVNDCLQTSNPKIYAAGDICSAYKFTHAADAMARIVIQNALFLGRKKASSLVIPWCTYTDPEIAHVGMYEREAKEKGIPVRTFTQKLKEVDRAILDGEDGGFVKVHVRDGTDQILGATLVARHAGEMLSEITLAMTGGLGLGSISRTIHPYPTQAESIKKLGDAYNRSRLTPRVKWILEKWIRWTALIK